MELTEKLKEEVEYIKEIINQNGPNPEDYKKLNAWYDEVGLKS